MIDWVVHVLDIAMYLMDEPRPTSVSANTYAEFGPRGLKGWVGRQHEMHHSLPRRRVADLLEVVSAKREITGRRFAGG